MSVENTLAERGKRYGDFADHAKIAQNIKRGMMCAGFDNLPDMHRQALEVIADKIARILSGDPNYADNWHDIQGYAKLVEDRLPKEAAVQSPPVAPVAPWAPPPPPPSPVSPWYGAPEWAKYKAQDEEGDWYWYEVIPTNNKLEGEWTTLAGFKFAHDGASNPNWRNTLISR